MAGDSCSSTTCYTLYSASNCVSQAQRKQRHRRCDDVDAHCAENKSMHTKEITDRTVSSVVWTMGDEGRRSLRVDEIYATCAMYANNMIHAS